MEEYEDLSGQIVNREKSELMGSSNINEVLLTVMGEYMQMQVVDAHKRYLGLPLLFGKNKKNAFMEIEDKMRSKVQKWKACLLSTAGKGELIKSCLEAVTIFSMSCYRMPKTLCDSWMAIAMNFWWSKGSKDRNIHWVSRDNMQKDKCRGGLGFRNLNALNEALLMKQIWRLVKVPQLWISRIYKNKYFRNSSILDIEAKPADSYAWKCIISVMEIFKHGIQLDQSHNEVRWLREQSGVFSVKSAYKLAREWQLSGRNYGGESSREEENEGVWKRYWKLKVPDIVKLLGWRIFHDALPVAENLRKRNCITDVKCSFCGYKEETCLHIFTDCWWSKALWNLLNVQGMETDGFESISDWCWRWMTCNSISKIETIVVGCWVIWHNRNQRLHGKQGMEVELCCLRIKSLLSQFKSRNILGNDGGENELTGENKIVVYTDGAWKEHEGGGMAAVVVKDKTILCCSALWDPNASSAKEMEWKALGEGQRLVSKLGHDRVKFLVDNAEIAWECQSGAWGNEEAAQVGKAFVDAAEKMKKWSIKHVLRESNAMADSLARKARSEKWSWQVPEAIPRILSKARDDWIASL